jgi:transposase
MTQHQIEISSHETNSPNQGRLLTPFQRKLLIKAQETEVRPEYQQRIEIMLLADRGYSQTQICEILGCCHQTARYWIAIAQAGQAHQWSDRQIGRPKTIDERYLSRLKELASHSPREYGYPFQRWTAQWLKKHLANETGIQVTEQHINRLLKGMGLSLRSRNLSIESLAEQPKADSDSINSPSIVIQDLHQTAVADLSCLFNWDQFNGQRAK